MRRANWHIPHIYTYVLHLHVYIYIYYTYVHIHTYDMMSDTGELLGGTEKGGHGGLDVPVAEEGIGEEGQCDAPATAQKWNAPGGADDCRCQDRHRVGISM